MKMAPKLAPLAEFDSVADWLFYLSLESRARQAVAKKAADRQANVFIAVCALILLLVGVAAGILIKSLI